jgi:hypothetical protein
MIEYRVSNFKRRKNMDTTATEQVRTGHKKECVDYAEIVSLNIIPINMSYEQAVKITNCSTCMNDANDETKRIAKLRISQQSCI